MNIAPLRADHRAGRHRAGPRCSRSSSTSAGRSSALARTLFFTPNVVSATVIGLVWVWLLDTQFGLVNHYLGYARHRRRSPG